jgi:hypothetical protein
MAFTNFLKRPEPRRHGAMPKQKNVTMMVLNRNYTHASVYGHAVRFVKGKPACVPNVIVSECVALGAERVDGEAAIEEEKEVEDTTPVHANDRMEAVLAAIEALIKRNERDDFTGTNLPKVKSLSAEAGFKVDKAELNRVWQERANRLALEARDGDE